MRTSDESDVTTGNLQIPEVDDLTTQLSEKQTLEFLQQPTPSIAPGVERILLYQFDQILRYLDASNKEHILLTSNTSGDTTITGEVTLSALTPNLPLKTGASSEVQATKLDIADTNDLSTALAEKEQLDFIDVGVPANPSVGTVRLFATSDSLWQIDSTGTQTKLGGSNTTHAWNFSRLYCDEPCTGRTQV